MSSVAFNKHAAMQSTLPQRGYELVSGVHTSYFMYFIYCSADKSLSRPGRKQANVSVRMA